MIILLSVTTVVIGQTFVSGAVSGVWDSTGSPFYVTDSVCVPSGDSLRIGPGVEVIFQGHYKFCVDSNAVLKAIGTAADSILFTAEDTVLTDSTGGHHGIRFYKTVNCSISYCRIEWGHAFDPMYIDVDNFSGGGVFCDSSRITITNCLFIHNYIGGFMCGGGGAICSYRSVINIIQNSFIENDGFDSASVIISYSEGVIKRNYFLRNTGAIFCNRSDPLIESNVMLNNSSGWPAGAIACRGSSPKIINNIIGWNTGDYVGGIACWSGSPLIINNTIYGNYGYIKAGAIYCRGVAKPTIINNAISTNTGVLADEIYIQGHISYICTVFIAYCDIDTSKCVVNNDTLDFCIFGPGNVNYDPMFVDTAAGDFRLQDGSPCIDAGAESVYIALWDTVIYAPDIDIDSNPRPVGLDWDIGAYESPYTAMSRIDYDAGWNLISNPSELPFDTDITGFSYYGYETPTGSYFDAESLYLAKGYWLLGTSAGTTFISGGEPAYTDTLYRGWNLIGSIKYPIPRNRIATEPPGLGLTPPYGWDRAASSYFTADSLFPGKGYWFLSSGNGRITVGP